MEDRPDKKYAFPTEEMKKDEAKRAKQTERSELVKESSTEAPKG